MPSKVGGWVKWIGTHKETGLQGIIICPEGGNPTTYEVEGVGNGWNLYKSGEYTCYRLRRPKGSTHLACNCPDAVNRDKRFTCKHVVGLVKALEAENAPEGF